MCAVIRPRLNDFTCSTTTCYWLLQKYIGVLSIMNEKKKDIQQHNSVISLHLKQGPQPPETLYESLFPSQLKFFAMMLYGNIILMSVAVHAHDYGMPFETTDIEKIAPALHIWSCSDTWSLPSEKSMVVWSSLGGCRMPPLFLCFAITSECFFEAGGCLTALVLCCAREIVALHKMQKASVFWNPCLHRTPIL